jgi:hypothetical protein
VAVGWRPADCWISNPYVLEVASLIGDLLVAVSTPYLKIIVALVIPGVPLYIIPKRFGLDMRLVLQAVE